MDRPELIIFDFDGTLVDSYRGIHRALELALTELDQPTRDLEWVRQHVGRGVGPLMEDAAGDADPAELQARFRERYEEVAFDATVPYPGVDGMLLGMFSAYRLAIASNKPYRWTLGLVKHLGWGPGFAAVLGPDSVGSPKPDPAMLEAILGRLEVAASSTLYVGDMPIDAETGRNAGVPVVGVATGSASRDELEQAGCVAVLDSAADLPSWIDTTCG